MPTNYTGRFTLIAIIVVAMLWCIFPGAYRGDLHADLKPGIDMVGGTSLLYEIKLPAGSTSSNSNLAEEVMEALKKRVDPDGVRNLIWRPQGATRLEIQMPLNRAAGDSTSKRDAFARAQEQLEKTNVRSSEVLRAVEKMSGDERRKELAELAQGSLAREKLFGALASVWDQIQQAKAQKNAALQAEKEIEYDQLKKQSEETNVSPAVLEQTLGGGQGPQKI